MFPLASQAQAMTRSKGNGGWGVVGKCGHEWVVGGVGCRV